MNRRLLFSEFGCHRLVRHESNHRTVWEHVSLVWHWKITLYKKETEPVLRECAKHCRTNSAPDKSQRTSTGWPDGQDELLSWIPDFGCKELDRTRLDNWVFIASMVSGFLYSYHIEHLLNNQIFFFQGIIFSICGKDIGRHRSEKNIALFHLSTQKTPCY